MTFGEKIKQLRKSKGLLQKNLSEMTGISLRSITYYETDKVLPNNIAILKKLAQALGTTVEELIDDREIYKIEAREKGGKKAEREIEALLSNASALFAGGDLSDDDKDKVMRAITEIYWDTKEKNKEKYTPKKYRKD